MGNVRATTFRALSVALVLAALALGAIAFYSFAASVTEVDGRSVGYLSGDAEVRRCPSTDCASTATYRMNQQVIISNPNVSGGEALGSTRWVEVVYGDEVRYVHGKFVAAKPVAVNEGLEQLLILATAIGWILVLSLTSWKKGQALAAAHEQQTNAVLATGTFVAGLTVGIAGFLVARADNQSTTGFVAGALANVGAGLVGAAVTFVLFQIFLSRRNPSHDQVAQLDAKLARVLRDLDRAVPQQQPASCREGALENGRTASRPEPRWPMLTWLVTTMAVGAAVGASVGARRRVVRRTRILDTPDTDHTGPR
jgi:uncharacterized membrane protein YeaQ/YmgE (transglycosylase-associated protein family)